MRNDELNAMIFCAGFGTRMRPLTDTLPKPMIEVSGRTLLAHALEQMPANLRPILNLHYLPEPLQAFARAHELETIFEPELLETGGGLKNALPNLDAPYILTSNSDAVWLGPRAADVLIANWDPEHMDALLLLVPLSRTFGHKGSGDFSMDRAGQLSRGGDYVFTGLQIIKSDAVSKISERVFSLNVVWNQIAKSGRIYGVEYSGAWCDVGQPESIEVAERMLAS